uniref:Uncharacterized protein n=1 Tax=Molossus molossus TaxID=27622 RepID=A0A7J8E2F0_MOLMO|nr:hypothetical protein HJG59_009010 [Molossus molossus]
MTGGRRCREGRNLTLPASSCATWASSCVGSSSHLLAPALGKSLLGTRGRKKKHLLVDWKNLQRRLFARPLAQPAASVSPVCEIHSPGFGDSSKGSELETDRTRPSPQARYLSGQGTRDRARTEQSGGITPLVTRPPRWSLGGLGRFVGRRGSVRSPAAARSVYPAPSLWVSAAASSSSAAGSERQTSLETSGLGRLHADWERIMQ